MAGWGGVGGGGGWLVAGAVLGFRYFAEFVLLVLCPSTKSTGFGVSDWELRAEESPYTSCPSPKPIASLRAHVLI